MCAYSAESSHAILAWPFQHADLKQISEHAYNADTNATISKCHKFGIANFFWTKKTAFDAEFFCITGTDPSCNELAATSPTWSPYSVDYTKPETCVPLVAAADKDIGSSSSTEYVHT